MILHKPHFLQNHKLFSGEFTGKKMITAISICIITLTIWNLPLDVFGIQGLTVLQRRIIAVFAFATLAWLTEIISAWATSVSVIGLLLFTASDNALSCFQNGIDKAELLPHAEVMSTFADPIIILFLGGFILAIAASKSGLDVFLAKHLLKPFGNRSENVLLGFILIIGINSMFLSNTATAAMMLTFLAPVLKALPPDGKGRVALTLSIPLAANIGGIATPIGTPPNAIALKYMNDPSVLNSQIGFGEWMAFMMPLTFVLLLISWFLLKKFFPFKQKTIELKIEGETKFNWRTIIVAITFITTIFFWMFDKATGMGTNTVAMIPIVIFTLTGVVTAKDLREINWSVIWMVAGGFALGLALNKSGLASNVIASIPFGNWSPLLIMVCSGLICYFLSNFISNTATAALLIPILTVVCQGMGERLNGIGGTATILIGIAISASAAMCLPISTPPNAIAHSTGLVEQKDMTKIGFIIGIVSLTLGYGMLYFLGKLQLI